LSNQLREYSRGNFNVKAITDRYNRQKERRRIEARDAQDRADDLAFARQEYEEEMAERTAPTRAMIKRAGRIPRQQRGDKRDGGRPPRANKSTPGLKRRSIVDADLGTGQ
jgi:hypothetical protein